MVQHLMADTIREAPFGQLLRWATKNRILKYPEEEDDFECPKCYHDPETVTPASGIEKESAPSDSSGPLNDTNLDKDDPETTPLPRTTSDVAGGYDFRRLENTETSTPGAYENNKTELFPESGGMRSALTRTRTRDMTRPYTQERFHVEQEEALQRKQSVPIIAQRNESGDILVDWYTTDDPANPQNWSSKKKIFVGLQLL